MSDLMQDLAGLSSAEEFFAYFGLEFDPRILASSRLHVLKRFHDNLASVDGLEEMEDAAKRGVYRDLLARAYADFVTGSALSQEAFPRLRQIRGAFVALSAVRLPKSAGPRPES